jgi:hypothetical protein
MRRRITLLFAALVVALPVATGAQISPRVELDSPIAPADNTSFVMTRDLHLKLPTTAVIAAEARHMQQRPSRDSLKNGTLSGMVIGGLAGIVVVPAVYGCFREENQGECDPGVALVGFGIGAAIGAAVGAAVDALRSESPGGGLRINRR